MGVLTLNHRQTWVHPEATLALTPLLDILCGHNQAHFHLSPSSPLPTLHKRTCYSFNDDERVCLRTIWSSMPGHVGLLGDRFPIHMHLPFSGCIVYPLTWMPAWMKPNKPEETQKINKKIRECSCNDGVELSRFYKQLIFQVQTRVVCSGECRHSFAINTNKLHIIIVPYYSQHAIF